MTPSVSLSLPNSKTRFVPKKPILSIFGVVLQERLQDSVREDLEGLLLGSQADGRRPARNRWGVMRPITMSQRRASEKEISQSDVGEIG